MAAALVAAVLFFFVPLPAVSQVKDPDLPLSPDVEFKSESDERCYQAEITLNGGSLSGDICFTALFFTDSGSKKTYYWENISSIRILTWVRRVKGKTWIFYPESYEVTLRNGTKIQVEGNIRELNRFRTVRNRKQRTLYSFYYDDYVRGQWINTGATDFYQPSLKPAGDCVMLIVFR